MEKKTTQKTLLLSAGLLLALIVCSLLTGRYPLTVKGLLQNEGIQRSVFFTLRVSRTSVAVLGGAVLGMAGFAYQTVFHNPLASPDVAGVSAGAGAGAAAGILLFGSSAAITASSFAGALLAVGAVLGISSLDRNRRNGTIVLAGIAVHSVAQTVLTCLKLAADPERQLASIEYWLMGSLSGISSFSLRGSLILCLTCMAVMAALYRQMLLLSLEEGEAEMLGVEVTKMRLAVLLTATLAVSAVISRTGIISFVGLIAPHFARLLQKNNNRSTLLLSALLGAILLTGSDLLARSVAGTELPVSIFTGLIGAPVLVSLALGKKAS